MWEPEIGHARTQPKERGSQRPSLGVSQLIDGAAEAQHGRSLALG